MVPSILISSNWYLVEKNVSLSSFFSSSLLPLHTLLNKCLNLSERILWCNIKCLQSFGGQALTLHHCQAKRQQYCTVLTTSKSHTKTFRTGKENESKMANLNLHFYVPKFLKCSSYCFHSVFNPD